MSIKTKREEIGRLLETTPIELGHLEKELNALYRLSPISAEAIFYDYFSKRNPGEAVALLTCFPKLEIKRYQKTIEQYDNYSSNDDPDLGYRESFEINNWSILSNAVLWNNTAVNEAIVCHYPEHISDIMAALARLLKYPYTKGISEHPHPTSGYQHIGLTMPEYEIDYIKSAKLNFLLSLKESHSLHYKLSHSDKQQLEEYFSRNIYRHRFNQTLQSKFCDKHADALFKGKTLTTFLETFNAMRKDTTDTTGLESEKTHTPIDITEQTRCFVKATGKWNRLFSL